MKYIQKQLSKNESVIYSTRISLWTHFKSLLIAGIVLILALMAGKNNLAFLTPIILIPTIIDYFFSEFAFTNKRVIVKHGFISVRTLETKLTSIESLNLKQTILGRILQFGSVAVIGNGGTKNTLQGIRNPVQFKNKLNQYIDNK
ncbi:MAG: PH domain-containing protein [Bacilli bacterium]|nr:PH domain-containing protein [Bacilli bacterium]